MRIGRYEVIDEIGAGGMGRVRLARDPTGRLVVLKTALRNDVDDDERLRDEARVGLRVQHPSLVETLELFEADDAKAGRQRPVLVTAYVPGVSLLELRRVGPADPVVVCRLGRQLAEALDAIHDARDPAGQPLNVLHRDVTAGNCLVGHDGRARLIDLGISRSTESRALRTETGLLRGTLRYLAPELFDGGQYSAQSDLWALGVVLWEALIGRAAVSGSDAVAVGRICSGNLMMLDDGEVADPRVSRAIGQLLKKSPADRPRRAREAAALFAMLEKALPAPVGQDAETLSQALVWRAIGGPVAEAGGGPVATSAHVERASRTFADEDLMTPTGPVVRPTHAPGSLPVTVADRAFPGAVPGSPGDAFQPKKTPSDAIADYAASLLAMERALADAWEKANASDRATLANLPVVTGQAISEKTAPAPASSSSRSSAALSGQPQTELLLVEADPLAPFLFEETDDDGPSSQGVQLPDAFSFPSALALPPTTPTVMPNGRQSSSAPASASSAPPASFGNTPATPSSPSFPDLLPHAPIHRDHDEISTPTARAMSALPAVTDTSEGTTTGSLRVRRRQQSRRAAILGLFVLLALAVAIGGLELGVLQLPT